MSKENKGAATQNEVRSPKAFLFIKRVIDILGALVGTVLTFFILLIVKIAFLVTGDKDKLIFKQTRIGKNGEPIKIHKIRSMVVNADEVLETILKEDPEKAEEYRVYKKLKDDPRITKVGRFIRRYSIDELPQLINVLKGDMSLVGPRPERPKFVEKFKEEIPRYMIKHQVRPGITGWAQVNGYRGDTSIRKRIEHDVHYIENWTLGFDIKILFLTVFKGFINKNAY